MILGCTHYPLVAPMLQRTLGRGVTLVTSGAGVARQRRARARLPAAAQRPARGGQLPLPLHRRRRGVPWLGTRFLQMPLGEVAHVELGAEVGGMSVETRNAQLRPRPGRAAARPTIEPGFVRTATGSALISVGETRVICTASVQESVPRWLTGAGRGWVTAEYGMLPASTGERKQRDVTQGPARRPHGRDPAADRPLAARGRSTSRRSASARSTSTATCSRPTAGRAAPRSPAAWSRCASPARGCSTEGTLEQLAAHGHGRRRVVRDRRWRAAARSRLLRGLDRRGRRERRDDRRRGPDRGPGDRGAHAALARAPRRPARARRGGIESLRAIQDEAVAAATG